MQPACQRVPKQRSRGRQFPVRISLRPDQWDNVGVSRHLIVTLIGVDRPGLVDRVSSVIAKHEGNWEASRMSRLAGRFAGILLVSVSEAHAESLAGQLADLEGLRVTVETSETAEDDGAHRTLRLGLVGNDRPGIVHDIAHALAERSISVEELSTDCTPAPMAGGTLFHLEAQLRCPSDVADEDLRGRLESLAHELMVDILLESDGD